MNDAHPAYAYLGFDEVTPGDNRARAELGHRATIGAARGLVNAGHRRPDLSEGDLRMKSVGPKVDYGAYDAVVIVTDHRDVDYARMLREARLVVDTRDALREVEGDREKVVRL